MFLMRFRRDVMFHNMEVRSKASNVAQMDRVKVGGVIRTSARVVPWSEFRSGDIPGPLLRWRLQGTIESYHIYDFDEAVCVCSLYAVCGRQEYLSLGNMFNYFLSFSLIHLASRSILQPSNKCLLPPPACPCTHFHTCARMCLSVYFLLSTVYHLLSKLFSSLYHGLYSIFFLALEVVISVL